MLDWMKPFQDGEGNRGALACIMHEPLENGATHLVRFADCVRAYFPNGQIYADVTDDDYDLRNIPNVVKVNKWIVITDQGRVHDFNGKPYAKKFMKQCKSIGVRSRLLHIQKEF